MDNDPTEYLYSCLEVTSLIWFISHDLPDILLATPDDELFTDQNSFIQDWTRLAGAAVMTRGIVFKQRGFRSMG